MTPTQLRGILGHLSIALLMVGLVFAEFVGAPRVGMVIALIGLIAYGGFLIACYLAWETGE